MPSKGDSRGDTPSLFPDASSPGRRSSADLRKAASLFDVRGEKASTDEHAAPARDVQTGDLFAWGARQQQIKVRPNMPSTPLRAHGRPFIRGPDRRGTAPRGAGLTRCLDGQGTGAGGLGRRRHVVRNRVLFTLLILAVVLYVIVHLALRS